MNALAPSRRWAHVGLIVLASAALCWPAIWNGYPLLAPDVMAYLGDGGRVWKALLGRGDPWFTPGRPEAYSAVIYLVTWGRSAWPAVVLQAVLTAWVLWLVVRAMAFRRAWLVYATVMAVLSAGTALPWTVSWPMPDILGALLYLAVVLLVFAGQTLSRAERWALGLLGCWAIAAHPSHLILAFGLLGWLTLLWLLRWRAVRGRGLLVLAAMVVAAVALQLAIHERILGKLTLNGPRPVYLMARVVSDGPAQLYLKTHCGQLQWTICKFQDRFTYDETDFLWMPNGVWMSADAADRAELRKEEMPLVEGTLRAYPWAQIKRSWQNFANQLLNFRIEVFPGTSWLQSIMAKVLPLDVGRYARTLQARCEMPTHGPDRIWHGVLYVSLLLIVALSWSARRNRLLMGMLTVVGAMSILNPAATAVLSGISGRYQSRVVWMVVLVAMLMAARVWESRGLKV